MMGSTIMSTRDRAWSPVLEELTAPALDCIQTGLAALADQAFGAGTHLALGARLAFAPTLTEGAPPSLVAPVDRCLAEARDLLGLTVTERRDGLAGAALRAFARSAGPLYVVADAFDMPWTPHRGQRHMEHGFVLAADDDYLVIDPYHNDTQWGTARPGVWRLSDVDLDRAVGADVSGLVVVAGEPAVLDPAALLAANATGLALARPVVAEYLARVRAGLAEPATRPAAMDALVLDIWLLGRSRQLHAAWLATLPDLPEPALTSAREHAQGWLTLATQSYLASRRIAQGGLPPADLTDRLGRLLAAEPELAESFADSLADSTAGQPDVAGVVWEAVRGVLGLDADARPTLPAFRALPNFNSFRLVDIIERIESTLGRTLDADDLTQDTLRDLDSLTELFGRVMARAELS